MRYILTILRREKGSDETYLQSFEYEAMSSGDTVATALTEINAREHLADIEGKPARRIEWESSCLQKKCGACAMVINGYPRLACDALLSDLKTAEIRVEPLRKFPCVCDLVTDRSIMQRNLMTLNAWLTSDSELSDRYRDLAYEGSECVQCGCCLEVCPNFYAGGNFYGMAVTPLTTRILMEQDREDYRKLAKEYSKHMYDGCGKSLACKDVCPRHIDTEKLMVNSNALAVWKRKKKG